MLLITFSQTKFHQYIIGRHTPIISDHKPLQAIVKKALDQATRRLLQGMLLKAQKYDITVEHIPGKDMHIRIRRRRRNIYLKSNKMVNTTLANSLLRRLQTQYVQHNIQYLQQIYK